jgi:hypothetical protein
VLRSSFFGSGGSDGEETKRPAPPSRPSSNNFTAANDSKGYADAALHLLESGLLPAPNLDGLRLMWKAGGQSRRAAQLIAQRWELVA